MNLEGRRGLLHGLLHIPQSQGVTCFTHRAIFLIGDDEAGRGFLAVSDEGQTSAYR